MSDLIPIKWVGALFDCSGYASASRNYVGALLDTNKVDLTLAAVSFEKQKTNHGVLQTHCDAYLNKQNVPYKINIVHLTPENYPNKKEINKYNIAYTVWETDRLPNGWVDLCNTMDEIWVPSQWNKDIFQKCGVTKHIEVIHHGIQINNTPSTMPSIMGVDSDVFVFYSIFQWIERKNPLGLLKAYLTEFTPDEKVCLALKTYRLNTTAPEKNIIKQDIVTLKRGLNLPNYPQVRFFGDLFNAEFMNAFHLRGDCFILPHRAEGFGIPHAEAMSYGKPVISTAYGGNLEFMNKKNSYLVDYQETPVCNMIFPNYNGHMTWADPNIMQLRQYMRYVFEHRKEAEKIGKQAQKDIKNKFNWKVVGEQMVSRLQQIQEIL